MPALSSARSLRSKDRPSTKFLSLSTAKSKPRARKRAAGDDLENSKKKKCVEINLEDVEFVNLESVDILNTEDIAVVTIVQDVAEYVEEPSETIDELNNSITNDSANNSVNSVEFEFIGGDARMMREEDVEDNIDEEFVDNDDFPGAEEENIKKKRSGKKVYQHFEAFENKEEFDEFWKTNCLGENYYHHTSGISEIGDEEIFRCKYYKKVGYKRCQSQVKVVYPGESESIVIEKSTDEHEHVANGLVHTNFSWKNNPEAENIVIEGVKHNDQPQQIKFALQEACIDPLPTTQQLNNKVATLRMKMNTNPKIANSSDLRAAILERSSVPPADQLHVPFISGYKIDIVSSGKSARFWLNITTHNLNRRLKNNPGKLFQIDGTYKLIWIPAKSKEGWSVQVHGTSNILNEFFPTGLCITSNENAVTYQEIFEHMEATFDYLMGDGARAITKGKSDVWVADTKYEVEGNIIDSGR